MTRSRSRRALVHAAIVTGALLDLACGSKGAPVGRDGSGGSDTGDAGDAGTSDAGDVPIDAGGGDGFCGSPLDPCSCVSPTGCGDSCVQTTCNPGTALCADLHNGTCECGFVLIDNCVKPESRCICPACGDGTGLCLTDGQRATLCAGSFRGDFQCP